MLTSMAVPTRSTDRRSSAEAVIRIEQLVKRFTIRGTWSEVLRRREPRRSTIALDDVSLEIHAGEIVGLLGPNGAGKTTLLKILSTLVTPDQGRAEIGGFDIVRDAARARRVLAPVAADERSLDWRLSARENLRFFGSLHGLRGPALRERVDEMLIGVELAAAGEKLVGTYSSGMRQRLLIARALLSSPRALLLDEPTRSLDPLAARAFRDFLRYEIARRQGCTVLLATHDPEEAMQLADRIAILDHGRLLTVDTPAELTRRWGDDRYRVWIRTSDSGDRLPAMCGDIRLTHLPEHDADGWTVMELVLAPDGVDAVDVLGALVRSGTAVGRFEKVRPTVADLMERVVAGRRMQSDA